MYFKLFMSMKLNIFSCCIYLGVSINFSKCFVITLWLGHSWGRYVSAYLCFASKGPKLRRQVTQPLLQICSNHYFHHPSNPCLHNQIGCAVNLRWLLRHHSCRRKDVGGPVGRERKAGSCHSSPLLSFLFFSSFFFQQTAAHCLPYSISCARQ